jgi:two-component system KDP operon response regulator KdpE
MSGGSEGPLVLVVEDELQMRRFLRAGLVAHGYRVVEATTATEALSLAPSHNPDLVLLDLGLPDADGLDVTRRLREWMMAPIIVVSARGREEDKVTTLDAGADDYLTKPFGMAELLARIRVALRHPRGAPAPVVVDIDGLQIDLAGHVVRVDGQEVHITPTAFRVLALLAKHAGRVLTHAAILKEVWGPGAVEQTHYVRVQVAELRRAIEGDPARPRYLLTEPGVGYRLRAP